MKNISKMIFAPIRRTRSWASAARFLFALAICLGWAAFPAAAQTAGDGAIAGTVTDSTGAVVAYAKVEATNKATHIVTARVSSSAGYYTISPLQPGTYSVQVTAKGFETLKQENLVVDALSALSFNPALVVGAASQTITVTAAPPVLQTEDATLGMTMENETYANLPILMNGAQRDPTAFATLTPGSQTGSRLPVIGGTGNYLGQLYLEGMPAETVSQQGDNRLVSLTMDLDAVDQFQLLTSSPPAEYMGAGAENFTMKSGGLKYHGQVTDFVRNTVFDSWAFTAKGATVKNALGATVSAPKPIEHQDELSATVGGVVPFTRDKLFFFVAYDKFHYRHQANPALYTIPTTLMKQGNFTELNGNVGTGYTSNTGNPAILFDPTTSTCNGTACSRTPLQSGGVNNIIPSNEISPIAQAMQALLPAPTNPSVLINNYLGSVPQGYDNHVIDWRVDFDLNAKHRISSVGAIGVENYLNNYSSGGSGATAYGYIPGPYVGGDLANIYPKDYVVGDTFTISPNLVNQLKFSYTRFFQNIHDATAGVSAWGPTAMGITNLPGGQASQEFPGAQFGATGGNTTQLTGWTMNSNSGATQLTTPNNFAITDNLQWLRGKHSLTVGMTYQFQEINNANPATYTGVLDLAYNAYSTANFAAKSGVQTNSLSSGSGFSYASYLLGAVGGSTGGGGSPSIVLQPVSEVGGRYKPASPYVEDVYKLSPKLTIDVGLRWDYLPPYHEVKDRWTFLNPNLTNGITGTPGMLQFAGNYGGAGVSCNCKTPVQTYWKNWGPRVAFAYEYNPKTVIRAGYAQVFSQGGGVGGRGGAYQGTGQTGFNMTAIGPAESLTGGTSAGPSFYLNNSTAFGTDGLSNTSLFGPGFNYPSAPTPGVAAQELNTGFYLNSSNVFQPASSVSYADPYLSGRAPELEMFNAGFERSITPTMTLAVNYVGNESHFIIDSTSAGANARGYWNNQLDPKYLAALGGVMTSAGTPLLTAQATPANIAILQAAMPSAPTPAFYTAAGAVSSKATIEQMLVAFPQYSGVSDTWGNVDNFSYHSLQITLDQRTSHGLTFNVNYTFSKNIGDDGTFRSGFDIPAAAISNGTKSWKQDRIERSFTTISIPQSLHAFGVYQLPFGKGHIGNDSLLVRWLAGGWQISGIYQLNTGMPVAVVWNGCSSTNYPGQGQCMPDLSSSYTQKNAHINGKWGSGPNGTNACNLGIGAGCVAVQYLDPNAFAKPQTFTTSAGASSGVYMIGNAPRTRPLQLRNPAFWDLDTRVSRTFPIHNSVQFIFDAACLNTWNHVNFGNPSPTWGSSAFGTITGTASNYYPRDFQFGGHLNF
jgi:hypothetical protein